MQSNTNLKIQEAAAEVFPNEHALLRLVTGRVEVHQEITPCH